jgi:hypothetical protein
VQRRGRTAVELGDEVRDALLGALLGGLIQGSGAMAIRLSRARYSGEEATYSHITPDKVVICSWEERRSQLALHREAPRRCTEQHPLLKDRK